MRCPRQVGQKEGLHIAREGLVPYIGVAFQSIKPWFVVLVQSIGTAKCVFSKNPEVASKGALGQEERRLIKTPADRSLLVSQEMTARPPKEDCDSQVLMRIIMIRCTVLIIMSKCLQNTDNSPCSLWLLLISCWVVFLAAEERWGGLQRGIENSFRRFCSQQAQQPLSTRNANA